MLRVGAALLLVFSVFTIWSGQPERKAEAAITNFTAFLSGLSEVPPVTSSTTTGGAPRPTASGNGSFVLDDVALTLTVLVTVFDIDCTGTQTVDTNDNLTAAHIHLGSPGVGGPVIWGFFGTPFSDNNPSNQMITNFTTGVGCTISTRWDAAEGEGMNLAARLPSIQAGNTYVNFHTVQFPNGELRGQLFPTPAGAVDLTAVKTNNVNNATSVGTPWTWNIRVANSGSDAIFPAGAFIFIDHLPLTGPLTYGAATISNVNFVTNASALNCVIQGTNTVACRALGASVVIPQGGGFNVSFTVTANVAGTYSNPQPGGDCRANPGGGGFAALPEANVANNNCSNSVVVSAATGSTSPAAPTATPVPVFVPPPVIPQVFQNPAAIPAIMGGIGNGTRNNTPVPARPAAIDPAVVAPAMPQLRPPSTGDAGLLLRPTLRW